MRQPVDFRVASSNVKPDQVTMRFSPCDWSTELSAPFSRKITIQKHKWWSIVYGLKYTHSKGLPNLNTAILAVLVIILGYSTFAVIVIRSSADTPLDENNPENVFTLLAYLNREQYGDRPLLYGQYWNSPTDANNQRSDGSPVYTKAYVVVNKTGRTVQWFSTDFDANLFIKDQGNTEYSIKSEYIVSDDRKDAIINYDRSTILCGNANTGINRRKW